MALVEYNDSDGNPMIGVGQLQAVAREDIAVTDKIPLPLMTLFLPGFGITVRRIKFKDDDGKFKEFTTVIASKKAGGAYINDACGSNRSSQAWVEKRREIQNVVLSRHGDEVFFKPSRIVDGLRR